MASMWSELKRRNVVRVVIAYAVAAWLVLQVADTVIPILELPDWISRAVLLLLGVGFVIAVIVAWAYELTPEGVKREKDVDRSQSITHVTGRKLDFVIIGVLAIALSFFALERFVWHDHEIDLVAAAGSLEKSIAVLPFDNRSADESDAYFVDGIHDDILTQLHKLSGIDKVISRTSVERYRNSNMSIPEIAAELRVATILEGGVQRAGNRIRITVQLIDAANEGHLWAENYNRELTTANVFEIQSEISKAIAESLNAVLTEEEVNEIQKLPTNSLAAWENYQLGKFAMKDRALDGLARAREYFEEAIEIDENFALAHVGLANSIILEASYASDVEVFVLVDYLNSMADARAAAQRALAINPNLGEAYASIGYSYFQSGLAEQLPEADASYRKAMQLSPNDVDLNRWYPQTLWLRPFNQPANALIFAERAVALDPLNSTSLTVLGLAYEMNSRFDEAASSFSRAIELSPKNVYAVRENIKFLQRQNEYSRAIVAGLDALTWLQDHPEILYAVAKSYRQLGDMEKFKYWSDRLPQSGGEIQTLAVDAMSVLDDGQIDSLIQKLEAADYEWWDGIRSITVSIAHAYAQYDQPEALLNYLDTQAPEMLDRENPEVWPQDAMLVAAAAWALGETGDATHADKLVQLGLEVARIGPRQANFGYGVEIADIEMHAVQGKHQFALEALTQAVEGGYRNPEWLDTSHFLDPLRSEPKFIAAMEVVHEDLVRQRAELEELERSGQATPTPQ